jgi:hypothetical protein
MVHWFTWFMWTLEICEPKIKVHWKIKWTWFTKVFPSKNFRVLFRQIPSNFPANFVNFSLKFGSFLRIPWNNLWFSSWKISQKDGDQHELFFFFLEYFIKYPQRNSPKIRETYFYFPCIFQLAKLKKSQDIPEIS